MEIIELLGQGEDLTILQMSLRALIIFVLTIILIRVAGRRSFGMKMPFDNVILILLGAILSRAVVGASPFLPTLGASLTLVIFHRLLAWMALYSPAFGKLIKGSSTILYKDGQLYEQEMEKYMISKKDLVEEIRLNSGTDSLEKVKQAMMERNGTISVLLKE